MRSLTIPSALILLTLAACSSTSSTASAPAQLTDAVGRLEGEVARCAAPAVLSLCWDGSAPAPVDPAQPGKPRCRAPIVVPDGTLSMATMAQLASRAIAWALEEQAARLARSDWDKQCGQTARSTTR